MQVILYENRSVAGFGPLTLLRPVFDLRCGALLLREKLEYRRPSWRVLLSTRASLAEWAAETYPDRTLAKAVEEPTLLLAANVIVDDALLDSLVDVVGESLLTSGGSVVGARIEEPVGERLQVFAGSDRDPTSLGIVPRLEIPARVVERPWELVRLTADEIRADAPFVLTPGAIEGDVAEGANLIEAARVSVGEGASVMPGVVLDATEGPVVVSPGARVMSNAVVTGPAFVGRNSVIKIGAKIYGGTSIGELCKVGGEVEGSVVHSCSNKQHEGFLGHSYLGSWVNLGAATDTSDLKNSYGTVRVEMDGDVIDTGSMFVGATVGDHSKTAIGTKLTTGAVIGIFANVVASGISPKSIQSFSWSVDGETTEYELEKAVATARLVMARRGVELTGAGEAVIRRAFESERRS